MPPAVVAAGIGAAGAIGGAALGASSSNRAAKSAAASQAQATQSQLQLGRETNALNERIYGENKAMLSPFVSRGNVAGDAINALLGLPSAPAGTVTAPAPAARAPVGGNSQLLDGLGGSGIGGLIARMVARRQGIEGNVEQPVQYNPPSTQAPAAQASPATTQQSQMDAFKRFADSAGMQFQMEQGQKAINQGYAARGMLESGAALKALSNYGQQTALNNYFMPYMGLLGGQQATGAQSAAATAGVGSNFVNTAAGLAGQMGNTIQNGANAQSNAALLRGANNAAMWNTVGSSLGGLASSFIGK